MSYQGRDPSRCRFISRSCVFIGICRDTKVSGQFPIRGGVSTFFRCEAPFLQCHEIERRIMTLPLEQKSWTPPRLQSSLQAPPQHHCSGLYGHVTWWQLAWLVASSETPGNRGPSQNTS